jgi:hypothetical protein
MEEAWEKLLLLFQPPPKQKLQFPLHMEGEGGALLFPTSSSVSNTVLIWSVPVSWDSSLHIPYHLCHGNECVMNQQA